jgi:hypothetical protein
LTFSQSVDQLDFLVCDIDRDLARADVVQVSGLLSGSPVAPLLTTESATPSCAISSPTATGTALCGNTQDFGNCRVRFSSPIDTLTIRYSAGGPLLGHQYVSVRDLTFQV